MKSFNPALPSFREYKKKIYQQIIKTGEFVYQIGELDDLHRKSKQVPINKIKTKEFRAKVNYLKKCLLKYRRITGKGRGISAVQVGIHEGFFIIYMQEVKGKFLTIINPKITKKSKKLLKYPEMCMSAVPITAEVVRPAWIEFKYYDEKGIKRFWKTKDTNKNNRIYNRVFQHEIDHINGIINIDRVDSKELIFQLDPKFYGKAEFEEVREVKAPIF